MGVAAWVTHRIVNVPYLWDTWTTSWCQTQVTGQKFKYLSPRGQLTFHIMSYDSLFDCMSFKYFAHQAFTHPFKRVWFLKIMLMFQISDIKWDMAWVQQVAHQTGKEENKAMRQLQHCDSIFHETLIVILKKWAQEAITFFLIWHIIWCMSLKYFAHQAFTPRKSLISKNHLYTFNVSM